ncbi:GSCFA domain-containing protein, partial [Luteimonas salinilitoris]
PGPFPFRTFEYGHKHTGAEIRTARKAGIVNKYNSRSMVQEMAWAAGESDFPVEAFLQKKGGEYYDPHIRREISECSLDELVERRTHIKSYFARALKADVIVATLGLSEYWFDEEMGLALSEIPDPYCLRSNPGRFSFCVSEVEDVIGDLNAVHDIVSRNGNPGCQFIVTTSPVPMGRRFTDQDVIIANMHSKSVLRIASLAFAQQHDNVDYYPSYEGAMLSDPRLVWASDRLHVSAFMVGKLIREFLVRYGVDVPDDGSDVIVNDEDAVVALRKELDRQSKRIVELERGSESSELISAI